MGPSGSKGRQAGTEGEIKGTDLSVGVCYSSTEKGAAVIASALCFFFLFFVFVRSAQSIQNLTYCVSYEFLGSDGGMTEPFMPF